MAKEIDKIIKSKTAPKSNNVLWDDGTNLKINRNGVWENVVSGGGSNLENRIAELESKIEELTERVSRINYTINYYMVKGIGNWEE